MDSLRNPDPRAANAPIYPPGAALDAPDPVRIDTAAIIRAVNECLDAFLHEQAEKACSGRMPPIITESLAAFLHAGGKRMRPLLCVIGNSAAGGRPDATVITIAASLEMFHAYALIHDDVMDGSETRRGKPTLHRALARHYQELARQRRDAIRQAAAQRFGTAGAILLGDLALVYSDILLHTPHLTPARSAAVHRIVEQMRTEVMYGQWLDLHTLGRLHNDLHAPLSVIHYKTATYSLQRPLHIGAALADAPPELLEALSAYALPLGTAFQLRDDILGIFGDPRTTGKPVLDDLREGKRTVLLALAHTRATPAQRRVLKDRVGDRHLDTTGLQEIRTILIDTGALDEAEHMIRHHRDQALSALTAARLPAHADTALRELADHAAYRHS